MDTLTIILAFAMLNQRSQMERAEQRIKDAQYCNSVERREQYRQSVLTQRIPPPDRHLSPAEEAGNHKAEIDRWLIMPEELQKLRSEAKQQPVRGVKDKYRFYEKVLKCQGRRGGHP
jgi:hypothetical protein